MHGGTPIDYYYCLGADVWVIRTNIFCVQASCVLNSEEGICATHDTSLNIVKFACTLHIEAL